jgi:hypothetical protein
VPRRSPVAGANHAFGEVTLADARTHATELREELVAVNPNDCAGHDEHFVEHA